MAKHNPPLFSVIVCSIEPKKQRAIRAEHARVFSDAPFEIIELSDARSPSEAYNRGFARSASKIVIFSHNDIEFLSNHIPETLLRARCCCGTILISMN
jgi:hypothetical protein